MLGGITGFLNNFDIWGLAHLLVTILSAGACITFHELSHAYVADRLGDPTAKNAGRITLNPLKHIDIVGLVMLLVVKVGWAKPVQVDMRNFKDPKKGMALTALAGPVSNFILALLSMAMCTLLSLLFDHIEIWGLLLVLMVLMCFFANVAIYSVGLGIFNLIPISPLDGSKVLYSFLPDKVYMTILHYERFVMLAVILLTASGVFSTPLSWAIQGVLRLFGKVTGCDIGTLFWMSVLI